MREQVCTSSTPLQKSVGGDSHVQGPWLACPLPSWSYSKLLAPPQHSAGSGTYGYSPRQTLSCVEDGQILLGAVAPQQHPGVTDTSCNQNMHTSWHLTSTYGTWTVLCTLKCAATYKVDFSLSSHPVATICIAQQQLHAPTTRLMSQHPKPIARIARIA